MSKLSTLYNPVANVIAQQGQISRSSVNTDSESRRDCTVTELANLLIEVAKFATYIEPKNFREAWNHPDPMQHAKWRYERSFVL
jgi:hypothetical protein